MRQEQEPQQIKSEAAEAEEPIALQQALTEERTRAEANLAGWQRAQADFINYKRRAEQEREEISKFANTSLILSLLPILDDLERAFAAIPAELDKIGWVEGIKLIERKLQATLEAQGLSPIKTLGEAFNPNLHEAAMHGRGREGVVIAELQKGYKFHERVIRPAMVVVGNGEEDKETEEE